MPRVEACALPPSSPLARYAAQGAFADCYVTELPKSVSHADFVGALYRGRLMRLERKLIGWFLSKPTSDLHVQELASGKASTFAVWYVEQRTPDELLLQDQTGRTRSWLMSQPMPGATRLYFGSAVLPRVHPKTGVRQMGPLFRPLLGFHVMYSRLLLASARSSLERLGPSNP